MARIAVLGTGKMGAAIASRLIDAGHRVTVWNRSASRTGGLVDKGARAAVSAAEAVADAEVVITMLADARAVETVLLGEHNAVANLPQGSCVVQMATIGPAAMMDLARRLPAGIDVVDAPVAGSVAAARSGELRLLVGASENTVERLHPILSGLGTVHRCGGVGTGSAAKLVVNAALIMAMAALADALAVAEAVGVDRDVALSLLATGPLGGAVRRATALGADFSIALAGKDIQLTLDLVSDRSVPVARAAATAVDAAPDQSADLAALVMKEGT
ncbi:MAG TPA: NAD(P)-binding domain-containing protein [Micromonosporaceae bacterium]|nr:NAD(P)-binding domain-containing protein [Micromonosporaceae bacterium]